MPMRGRMKARAGISRRGRAVQLLGTARRETGHEMEQPRRRRPADNREARWPLDCRSLQQMSEPESLRGDDFNLPGDTLIDDVCRFLKCSKCGSRDVLTPDPAARS